MFSRLTLSGWRHFRDVDISFHPRLTVLTGANGAGKTTILNVLSQHFGWSLPFVSTPRRGKAVVEHFSDWWEGRLPEPEPSRRGGRSIGTLEYLDGHKARLVVPEQVTAEYQVSIEQQRPVSGIFVSSHRPVFFYQPVQTIPTQPTPRDQLLNVYLNEYKSRYSAGGRISSPSLRLKEALISLAVFGYGNEVVQQNLEYRRSFDEFQSILSAVLPGTLGFRRLRIEMPEIILETDTGNFSLDAVSGGISAIFDLAWQIYMYSTEHEDFSVIVDEPENHLHPELQKSLLPSLLTAFPKAQFVVATHNPFMVSSVRESNVYVLRFGQVPDFPDSRFAVGSQLLDLVNKAGTANEILRDVLGLDFTFPQWVGSEIEDIVDRYSGADLTTDVINNLRGELARLGMESALPDTVDRLSEAGDDQAE